VAKAQLLFILTFFEGRNIMCRKLIYVICFVSVLTLASTNAAFGAFIVEVRVAATNDDAEEKVVGGG